MCKWCNMPEMQEDKKVRLDRWLWAARFFKTRSLAVEAVKGGRVSVNGQRVKPARQIAVGDNLSIRKAQLLYEISVTALSEKRLSAVLAQQLYHELESSRHAREQRIEEIRAARQTLVRGRPSKRDRRLQQAIKRQTD